MGGSVRERSLSGNSVDFDRFSGPGMRFRNCFRLRHGPSIAPGT